MPEDKKKKKKKDFWTNLTQSLEDTRASGGSVKPADFAESVRSAFSKKKKKKK